MINKLKLNYKFSGTEKVYVNDGRSWLLGNIVFSCGETRNSKELNKARFHPEAARYLTPAELIEIAEVTEALGKIKAELVAVNVNAEATYLELMKNFLWDAGAKKEG